MDKVRFNRGQRRDDAILGESGVIYFASDTGTIVLDGIEYGKGGISEDEKKFLLDLMENSRLKVRVTSDKKDYSTRDSSITLTVKTWYGPANIPCSPDSVSADRIFSGIEFKETKIGEYRATKNLNTDDLYGVQNFVVSVKYGDIVREIPITLGIYHDIIWGWSKEEVLTSLGDLKGGGNLGPLPSISGCSLKFSEFPEGGFLYIAIPGYFWENITYGYETGLPVIFEESESLGKYKVYRIKDEQDGTGHTIEFL